MHQREMHELRRIQERFNTLGASLQRASANNKMLIDRMMALQESEREDIARELNNQIGFSAFFLRAELVGVILILRMARSPTGSTTSKRY
jgi:glucose-6-phosphate-specific signal transduction histidine kinase